MAEVAKIVGTGARKIALQTETRQDMVSETHTGKHRYIEGARKPTVEIRVQKFHFLEPAKLTPSCKIDPPPHLGNLAPSPHPRPPPDRRRAIRACAYVLSLVGYVHAACLTLPPRPFAQHERGWRHHAQHLRLALPIWVRRGERIETSKSGRV